MKDFYDIWLLIQQFDFDRQELRKIIHQVLKNRGTVAETLPIVFLESFYDNDNSEGKQCFFLDRLKFLNLKQVVLEFGLLLLRFSEAG